MRTKVLALAAVGLVLAGVTRPAAAGAYAPKVGERHPDFTLPAIADRAAVSLSDYLGKKVLLIQFASW